MKEAKKNKNESLLAKLVKKNIQRGFGKRVCKEMHIDCANCKAQVLIGHLNWYIDLLEWGMTQEKTVHKRKEATSRER